MEAKKSSGTIAGRLDQLAHQELDEVKKFLGTPSSMQCAVLLIEARRCLDHIHVVQLLSKKNGEQTFRARL